MVKKSIIAISMAILIAGCSNTTPEVDETLQSNINNTEYIQKVKNHSTWLTYYYLEPKPDSVIDNIKEAHEIGYLDNKNSVAPISGFFAEIIKANPNLAKDISDIVKDYPDNERRIFVTALYYSDIKNKFEYMQKIAYRDYEKASIVNAKKIKFAPMVSTIGTTPAGLDRKWGAFMASGNKMYIYQIANSMILLTKKDKTLQVTGKSARWSLKSNAKQHDKVYQSLKEYLKDGPNIPLLKKLVQDILTEVDKERQGS
jgi:hypothetical protein